MHKIKYNFLGHSNRLIKQVLHLSFLVGLVSIIACDTEDPDLLSPTMDIHAFTPAPTTADICGQAEPGVFVLTGGEQLNFDVTFNDNDVLSQYKIDIHNNFDCHGHGGGSAPSVVVPNIDNQTTDWTILEIQNLEGSSAPINRSLAVPPNVTTGSYHFQIQVVDVSGNDNGSLNLYSLKVNNPLDDIAPQIAVDVPAATSFSVQKGDKIRFAGQVTDDRSLSDGGNGVLYLAYTDLSSGNTFNTESVFVFDETVDQSFDFDFEYTVPQTLVAGSYRFSLGANDGVRNVADFQFFEIEITN